MSEERAAADRLAPFLPLAAGVVLVALGLRATLASLALPISPYDEGLLLTDASLISAGQVPYRDFYANYPPGVFLAIAGLWKLFGVSVAAERAIGVGAHLVAALGAGWLAGRLRGARFSPIAAGLTLIWLAWLGPLAFAWVVALALALVACALLLWASERDSRVAWAVAGFALGLVGCFRHDLFIYLATSLAAVAGAWEVVHRRMEAEQWKKLGWLTAGAALPLAALWIPVLALAGVGQVVDDLYTTQLRVLEARSLPVPELLRLQRTVGLPFPIPPFLVHNFEGAVALTVVGPALGMLAVVLAPRLGLRDRVGPSIVLALAVAVLPQMLGRTDTYHAIFTMTPSLVLACAVAESALRGPSLWKGATMVALAALLASPARTHLHRLEPGDRLPWQGDHARYGGLPEPEPAREAVLEFVAANTRPGDPIYVGLVDHSYVYISEMDLYFLTGRTGATRVMQFDPNVVDQAAAQRGMIADIEARGTRVAVLSSRFRDVEPPTGPRGATALDAYLRTTFEVVRTIGPYQFLRRRAP